MEEFLIEWLESVPNVPYGVESAFFIANCSDKLFVPNVPYGVERTSNKGRPLRQSLFLMYRLELKGPRAKPSKLPGLVPNVPCGEESLYARDAGKQLGGFLMYRAELKASILAKHRLNCGLFLMYRVELKEHWAKPPKLPVPRS